MRRSGHVNTPSPLTIIVPASGTVTATVAHPRHAFTSAAATTAACAALTAAAGLCGCASGSTGTSRTRLAVQDTQTTARQVGRQSASSPGAPAGGAPTGSAAGRAASSGSTPAGRAHPEDRPSRTAASVAGPASFQARANSECAAAASGLPGAAHPSDSQPGSQASGPVGETNSGYAQYTLIERKIQALSSLRPPAPLRVPAGLLVSVLRRLQQLYLAGAQGTSGPPQGVVSRTEQQALGAAMAAGVPECAPTDTAPPGQAGEAESRTGPAGPARAAPPARLAPPASPGPGRGPSPTVTP